MIADTSLTQSRAAKRAWATMRSPEYKARKTARLSQEALREWAASHGFHVLFLDAPSGNPRTGIVDALLVKISSPNADELEIRLVQLKGGGAGLKPTERTRLVKAAKLASVVAAIAMWDRETCALDVLATDDALDGARKGK